VEKISPKTQQLTRKPLQQGKADRQDTFPVTCEDECYRISSAGTETVEELHSTHGEADTRLILHAAHAARSGYETVIVISEDTDVFVLCLTFKGFIQTSLYCKCGTQTRTRYVSISSVVQAGSGRKDL